MEQANFSVLSPRHHSNAVKYFGDVFRRSLGLLSLLMTFTLLAACSPQLVRTEGPVDPANSVLIITGAGMVPRSAKDPRYEETWLNTTASYSSALKEALDKAGVAAQLYMKKDRIESPEQTLARLVAKEPKDAIIQVSITHVRNSDENTVYLDAEFMPLVYESLSDGTRRVVPQSGPRKHYPLMSMTKKDMRDTSLSGLAKTFVQELQAEGKIK